VFYLQLPSCWEGAHGQAQTKDSGVRARWNRRLPGDRKNPGQGRLVFVRPTSRQKRDFDSPTARYSLGKPDSVLPGHPPGPSTVGTVGVGGRIVRRRQKAMKRVAGQDSRASWTAICEMDRVSPQLSRFRPRTPRPSALLNRGSRLTELFEMQAAVLSPRCLKMEAQVLVIWAGTHQRPLRIAAINPQRWKGAACRGKACFLCRCCAARKVVEISPIATATAAGPLGRSEPPKA